MEYDYRNKPGPPYNTQVPTYRPPTTASQPPPPSASLYGQSHASSLYPRIGQPFSQNAPPSVNPLAGRHPSFNHAPPPPPSSSTYSSGIGIRVSIKPEYRITPPPQLAPVGDIPRSNFHFDFDLERKILAEADKENPDWSSLVGLENIPSKPDPTPSLMQGTPTDPLVSKYIASGLNKDAVPIAVANYGDNPTKVKEFVNGYTLLKEMGFSSNSVAEALFMYDNDTDKALAHFLNNPS